MNEKKEIETPSKPKETANADVPALPSVPPAPCTVIWITACLLAKTDTTTDSPSPGKVVVSKAIAQTLSWRSNCNENEARGDAVTFALGAKPGWAVENVTTAKIEIPADLNQKATP